VYVDVIGGNLLKKFYYKKYYLSILKRRDILTENGINHLAGN
jgi:hypothetical protein